MSAPNLPVLAYDAHRFSTAADAYAALLRSRGEPARPATDDHDALSDRVAAAGVRQLLDGRLTGPPLPVSYTHLTLPTID